MMNAALQCVYQECETAFSWTAKAEETENHIKYGKTGKIEKTEKNYAKNWKCLNA